MCRAKLNPRIALGEGEKQGIKQLGIRDFKLNLLTSSLPEERKG